MKAIIQDGRAGLEFGSRIFGTQEVGERDVLAAAATILKTARHELLLGGNSQVRDEALDPSTEAGKRAGKLGVAVAALECLYWDRMPEVRANTAELIAWGLRDATQILLSDMDSEPGAARFSHDEHSGALAFRDGTGAVQVPGEAIVEEWQQLATSLGAGRGTSQPPA